jgi:hypothetical protein
MKIPELRPAREPAVRGSDYGMTSHAANDCYNRVHPDNREKAWF